MTCVCQRERNRRVDVKSEAVDQFLVLFVRFTWWPMGGQWAFYMFRISRSGQVNVGDLLPRLQFYFIFPFANLPIMSSSSLSLVYKISLKLSLITVISDAFIFRVLILSLFLQTSYSYKNSYF